MFDLTSWRFFKDGEFADASPTLYVAYVLSEDEEYRGDFFIFPAREFSSLIRAAPLSGEKRRVYISRCVDDPSRWVLRRMMTKVDRVTDETCLDVTPYRRNFEALNMP